MEHSNGLDRAVLGRLLDFQPRRADIRKMDIINAVIDCIASPEGVSGLNSMAISKQAGMLRSHVAYYFPNQKKMLLAAIHYVVAVGQEAVVAALAEERDPRRRLEIYVDSTFFWLSRHPKHMAVFSLLQYTAGISKAHRALLERIKTMSERRVAELLLSKRKKSGAAAAEAAHSIRNLLVGSLVNFYGTEDRDNFDRCRKQTKKAILKIADAFWK